MTEIIRVLRVLEYIGPRQIVETPCAVAACRPTVSIP